jgi:hypothetical protein
VIEWTEQATRQLDQAHDYIALSNSEEVAARITMQWSATFNTLRSTLEKSKPGSEDP